jgi:RecA/RadA recombinase
MSADPVLLPSGGFVPDGDPRATKHRLEELLQARRLQREAPPLRGEDRRLRPLATGIVAIDALLGGGFPRGQLSQLYGPASSGRSGLLLALMAQVTRGGGLVALVDALDSLDPASAAASGVDLPRLLWLRGPRGVDEDAPPKLLADATAAVATLAGSGLFDLVALDVVATAQARRTLPHTTWLRLQRLVEDTATALVLVADAHVACAARGVSLVLEPAGVRWSAPAGPARLLQTLDSRGHTGSQGRRTAALALQALA